jgi:hypothetical protein
MHIATGTARLRPTSEMTVPPIAVREPKLGLFEPLGPPTPWNLTTFLALVTLIVLWAVQVYATWAAWGNLTIDSGHEMYIPALLAQGKQLYRDVWFMYGPAAPYFNSYLFRLFGMHLNVLYWAGSLSALGSAIFLYLTGMQLSSWLVGWTAGAVIVTEAFHSSLFCFPLPYSFAAVYACLAGCLFLWLVIKASTSAAWSWMFGAGTAAAVALLLKPEFGITCYGTLAVLIAVRSFAQRSWRLMARDAATILPGVAACGFVIRWMVSIRGIEFITQENIVSWPTSYFMKTYGKMWLEQNGFTITGSAFRDALFRAVPITGAVLVSYCLMWWKRSDMRAVLLKIMATMVVLVYLVARTYSVFSVAPLAPVYVAPVLSAIFFPRDMVLYVGVAALVGWCFYFREPSYARASRSVALLLLLTFSSLLAFRVLMKMTPYGYPIYYNGPAVICFLLLACRVIPRSRSFTLFGETLLCCGCLSVAVLYCLGNLAATKSFVALTTDRGTVRVSPQMAERYEAAIQFMKEKASLGESVLSVPEDTSLYFLSGTHCPIRVFSFTPGVLAPGKMTDETIRSIEQNHIRYLLWSNRTFSEFGVPVFGKDFDREVGDYLETHYRRVGRLTPNNGPYWGWTAFVWQRVPEAELK